MDNELNIHTDSDPQITPQPPGKSAKALWIISVVLGTLFTIAAWVSLMLSPTVSIYTGAAGLVLSAVGIWGSRSCWRDIAITSVIASGVILAVHLIFTWALDYALSAI